MIGWMPRTHGSTEWQEINPASPFYLFSPRDDTLKAQYRRFVSIPDVFQDNSVGIVTARDHLTIHWTPEEVWDTVRTFFADGSRTGPTGVQTWRRCGRLESDT